MRQDYRDNYYGSILDPLHGDIKLSEIEKWCLAQPIFSRLRYVKQNTFLYYVFPSANHTRFEHSIGVMHMAGKIFDSCKENYATGEKKRRKYSQKKESFFNILKLEEFEPLYYQELRLAGLLHDIGHGPMSHLFDEFCISNDIFLKIVGGSKHLKKYYDGFKQLIEQEGKVEHETLSCAYIFDLIDKLKSISREDSNKFSESTYQLINQLSSERIVKMISPKFPGLSKEILDSNNYDYLNFFSKVITAFPIDADRMDYLIRDSYFSGVTYGIYDLNRTYSSFQAILNGSKVELVFKESGIDAMLRFIQSRSHLYNQVYFHKTNRAVNTMLTYATASIRNSSEKLLDGCKSFDELKKFYIENSDDVFVKQHVRSRLNGIEKEVLDELIERKLFKRVFEKKIVLSGNAAEIGATKGKIMQLRDEIKIKLESLAKVDIYAEVDYFENNTFKDAASKNVALARKSVTKDYEFMYDWTKAGKEFEMSNMVVCMIRIYLRRTFHSSTEFEQLRKEVIDKVKAEIEKLSKYHS